MGIVITTGTVTEGAATMRSQTEGGPTAIRRASVNLSASLRPQAPSGYGVTRALLPRDKVPRMCEAKGHAPWSLEHDNKPQQPATP
jgi:hypothetical protein